MNICPHLQKKNQKNKETCQKKLSEVFMESCVHMCDCVVVFVRMPVWLCMCFDVTVVFLRLSQPPLSAPEL